MPNMPICWAASSVFCMTAGRVPDDWLARQVRRIDRTDGDIDTLSKRLAYIRTWTYVAQRTGWVEDESHWRGATRAVEDRLSDALHGALTQRFVDRRTSVLLRRLKQKESLVAEVTDSGEVTVEGQVLGRIDGFRFRQDETASPDEAKTLRQAAMAALQARVPPARRPALQRARHRLRDDGGGRPSVGRDRRGRLVAGPEAMKPTAEAFVEETRAPR
jgi:ATP-dependent RNA helicase SUPV3L1/SUV3